MRKKFSRLLQCFVPTLCLMFFLYPKSVSAYTFPAAAKWHDYFSLSGEIPMTGAFNPPAVTQRDDIITFTNDANADVWVALNNEISDGFGTATKWHDYFAPAGEIPLVGDFDGDDYDDIITFTSDSAGDVWVALNNGDSFGTATKWHDWFAPGDEVPVVGDFNGDNFDDIATFTSDDQGDVWVAFNTHSYSFGEASKWHDYFAPFDEIPAVGNFDGDANGYDDIVTFTSDGNADVYVAFSNGSSSFSVSRHWHNWFAPNDEIPLAGDINGDGYWDIITFTSDASGDVWLSYNLSGLGFDTSVKVHDYFAPNDEIPALGDFDYDNINEDHCYYDLVTFTHDTNADVWVSITSMGNP